MKMKIQKKILIKKLSPYSKAITGDHKVHIFWEGHKILKNLHLTFDYRTYTVAAHLRAALY